MQHFVNIVKQDEGGYVVVNSDRTCFYTIKLGDTNVTLKASCCPEYSADYPFTLFLRGSDSTLDDSLLDIPRKYLKHFVYAAFQYNIAQGNHEMATELIVGYKFKCPHCNKYRGISQFSSAHFEYCIDCVTELKICEGCHNISATHKFGDEWFCDHCVQKNGFCQVCETTPKVIRNKCIEIHQDYHGENKYLQVCATCWDTDITFGKENHYHYRPQFNFWDYDFKKNKRIKYPACVNNKLFMGTEIEVQFANRKHPNIVLGKILKIYGEVKEDLLFAKHDGSVPDPGSEIVTHPMTLNMIRSLSWKGLFSNIIVPTQKGIGGHIHINKTAFLSPLHVYKFCNFLRSNVSYIEWIGERSLMQEWCKPASRNGKTVKIAKNYMQNQNQDRYEMINFTTETIELRFFWSPSTTAMLLKNVEFVDSLYNFTKECTLHFGYRDFEKYIEDCSIYYPYLYNFILSRTNIDSRYLGVEFRTNQQTANMHTAPPAYVSRTLGIAPDCTREPVWCTYCDDEIVEGDYSVEVHGNFMHPNCEEAYRDELEETSESAFSPCDVEDPDYH